MRNHQAGPRQPLPEPERPWPERPWPGRPLPQRPTPPPPQPAPPGGPVHHVAPSTGPDPVLERLLDERIVHLGRELDDDAAERAVTQLLLLGSLDPRRDITLHLTTLSGSAAAGLAVYDTLRTVGPDVATRAVGLVGSVGALLLAAGTPGKRRALPHARIQLRHPSAGGAGLDPAARAAVGDQLRQEAVELLARHTGRTPEAVAADLTAQRWLTAPEAAAYGLVDQVMEA
jgi:ATP-dependent Clp protease protease subunit